MNKSKKDNNWIKLLLTHNTKEILPIFNDLFLSIYFFKLTEGNLLIIVLYNLVHCILNSMGRYTFSKIVNKNNILSIYKLSMLLTLCCSGALILLGSNIINYIFIYNLVYTIASSYYWGAYETIICQINKNGNYKKYFAIHSVLYNMTSILVPTIFGILIEKYSYLLVFIILSITISIAFIQSLFLNKIEIKCDKLHLKDFVDSLKKLKLMKINVLQNILDGFTAGGVIDIIITLMIYNKLSSETTVGIINTVIGIIGILMSMLCTKLLRKENFGKIVIPITIIIMLLTIPIAFKVKIELVILFNLFNKISYIFTDIMGTSLNYQTFGIVTEEKYKVDYLMIIQFLYDFGRMLGFVLILVCVLIFKNIDLLNILFIIFAAMFVVRTFLINKMCKFNEIKSEK